MPVITPVTSQLGTVYGHATVVTWANILAGDTCSGVQMMPYRDRCVHAFGTFGGAASTIAVHGSNEVTAVPPAGQIEPTTSYTALHDPQGIAISLTAKNVETISEFTAWVKPVQSGGDGTTSVTVSIMFGNTL